MEQTKHDTQISQGEMDVLRVIWSNQPIKSSQVIDFLSKDKNWQPSTIKTLIGRLNKKGLLEIDDKQKPFLYSAKVDQAQIEKQNLEFVLNQVCSTKHGALLADVIENLELSFDDIDKIKAALDNVTAVETVTCHCLPGQCNCHIAGSHHH